VRALPVILLVFLAGCRVERVAPNGGGPVSGACDTTPRGELWIYTSIYRHVLDKLEPLIHERMPEVSVQWFQAGGEKIQTRLEAEIAAGGIQADVLAQSDPFLVERFKQEKRWLPYVSVHALAVPRTMIDMDGTYVATRVGVMVIVTKTGATKVPKSFRDLTSDRYRGRIAVGDPLSSGTATVWAYFMQRAYGVKYFNELRTNRVVVAGGNAAVLQKVETGEVDAGVLLMENALLARANGSRIEITYPTDGAVVIPQYTAIFATAKNPVAAKAFVDLLLSPEGQKATVEFGDMHAANPAMPGPRGEPSLDVVLQRGMPIPADFLQTGVAEVGATKQAFSEAFAK
jgi:iron(III) transport system substrate-binding protein